MSGRQYLVVGALVIGVVASGIQVALVSHEVRQLHGELEAAQKAQDEHLAEYSRLLLERSALSAYQNVERLAERELAMQFPDTVEFIEP
ncbi:MAG: cell division protein FtsL [Pseudomonadales bacterium]